MSPGDPISDLLAEMHERLAGLTDGEPASYIPELAGADPDLFGISVCMLDGHGYAAGAAGHPFTIQSVSKPFVYALALADRGLTGVLARVGVEPSGEGFNAISLEPGTGRPPNPMVNAGAIVVTSLVAGGFAAIRDRLGAFAGHPLAVDERVCASEAATGDRNRAIAYLMHGAGSLTCPADEALDAYFRQCSVLVTTRDLAVMGATLASGGTNPVTGERVVSAEIARHVLTVMATCGMYDFAGEWMLRVGLPAKSGVSGGLLCVLPSQVGVAIFSPPLDSRGNSVRAIAVCEELSGRYGLHMMHRLGPVGQVFSLATTGQTLRSWRDRPRRERDVLTLAGGAIAIRRVHGDLSFAAAEAVVRTVLADRGVRWLILDLDRVAAVPPVSARLLAATAARLAGRGTATVVVDSARRGLLSGPARQCGTLEEALSCCEDALLASESPGRALQTIPLAGQDLLLEMDSGTLRVLAAHMQQSQFPDGAELPDVPLCFITSGRAAAYTTGTTAVGKRARVASAEPGTAVGRLALDDEGGLPRTWYAAGPLTCYLLTDADLARLAADEPAVLEALRWAIARRLAARVRDLSARYQALAR